MKKEKSETNRVAVEQILSEKILAIMQEHSKNGKETILRLRETSGDTYLCKVLTVGSDFIEVLDNEGRQLLISLYGTSIRDVTNEPTFPFKGDKS